MGMTDPAHIRFGNFELELETGTLRRSGIVLKLQPRPASMLCLLASRPGQLVSRGEIQRHLWGERAVEVDHGINTCVRQIRAALNDPVEAPAYVETVPRKGYRFIAPVTQPASEVSPVSTQTRFRVPAWGVVVAVLAIVVSSVVWLGQRDDRVTVAVLPFLNSTGDQEADYFAAGITEEIVTELTKVDASALGVISRTSTMRFVGHAAALDSVKTLLDVEFVVQGNVRRDENGVRVTVQLVRLSDRTQIWAERYDHQQAAALAVSATVAEHVARALVPNLLPNRARDSVSIDNSPARELVLRGRYALAKGGVESVEQAVHFFQSAITTDTSYALAYLGLADALFERNHTAPNTRMDDVRRYALRAVSIDRTLAAAHLRLGSVALYYSWDRDASIRALRRAIELAPGAAEPHRVMADYYTALGEHALAIESIQLAVERDPLSPGLIADVGMTYYAAREFEKSLEHCQAARWVEPQHPAVLDCFLRARRLLNQPEAAAQWAVEIVRAYGDSSAADSIAGAPTPEQTLTQFDNWMATKLRQLAQRRYVSPFVSALVATYRGRRVEALEYLKQGRLERDRWMIFLDAEPRFDPLRTDPAFKTLLETVRL